MSNGQQIQFGAGAELSSDQQQQFQRKGKRRNCIFIPGSSNPDVAQKFSDALYKQCFGVINQDQFIGNKVENPQQ